MSRCRPVAPRHVLGVLAVAVPALVGCASSESDPGYLYTTEIAAFADPSVRVELAEGCGELGPPERVTLHGRGHDAVLLPAGCRFRVHVEAPAGGRLRTDFALHPGDVIEIAEGGLAAPRFILGWERSGAVVAQHCVDLDSNLLSDTGWRRRILEIEAGSPLVVFGEVEASDTTRGQARLALGSWSVEAQRREPWPIDAASLPEMPDEFAARVPPDLDAVALWARWVRNRAVFSAALDRPPSDVLGQAVLAAARDQEESFATFTRDHPEDLFWALWQRVPGAGDDSPGARPDLLLLVADCARRDHLSAYGYRRATTPELDARLAARGILFADAYSIGSATNYSMPSMMTGVYPTRHRFQRRMVLGSNETTLAQRLRGAGYFTAGVSTNPFLGPGSGLERGFAIYDSREREYTPYPRAESAVARAEELAIVLRWLPTFLYVHVMDAHGPYRPPPPFDRIFDARPYGASDEERNRRASPPFLTNESFAKPPQERPAWIGIERLVTLYDGSLRYVDQQLGRLLATLEQRGLLEHTAVLLTADHGEEFLEHDLTYHDSVPHEEKVQVPLIVKPHAGFPRTAPDRVERPVDATLGVLPTLLELAGLPPPAGVHGSSLLSPAADRGSAAGSEPVLFHDNDRIRAVRQGPWKLITIDPLGEKFPEVRLRGIPSEMLFRLDEDPAERVDLREREPEKASELRGLLEEQFAPIETAVRALEAGPAAAPEAGLADPTDQTRRERLRALGYLQ